ncbi:MAG: carbamoyl phosphate synthase small subunit [Treponema sp.]|nr:carbamoyl phosphate synthase small subunit [Treponema sp.]
MDSTDKAFLLLADGSIFEGQAIGARGKTIGETVFTTGMTGYLETLTDPSYFGQIVTQTFPLIGNYGIMKEDFESRKSWVKGYIVRELCEIPSNFRCQSSLENFLKEEGIIGIAGIDTRALTKKLRNSGVMNGMIISGQEIEQFTKDGPQKFLPLIKSYKIQNALQAVQSLTSTEGTTFLGTDPTLGTDLSANLKGGQTPNSIGTKGTDPASAAPTPTKNKNFHVVLLDFGAKANIQRELEKRGCKVTLLPYNSKAQDILNLNPHGIMLSNGPGDPAENVAVIEEIKKICEWNKEKLKSQPDKAIAIFGICLGHQILALARGAKTSKLKYGHRGGNHPVKDTQSGRVFITSQNHGYAVENTELPAFARQSFVNLNDGTCEGLSYTDIPAFSVQFHPEACGGPHDTNFLFDNFLKLMETKNATK